MNCSTTVHNAQKRLYVKTLVCKNARNLHKRCAMQVVFATCEKRLKRTKAFAVRKQHCVVQNVSRETFSLGDKRTMQHSIVMRSRLLRKAASVETRCCALCGGVAEWSNAAVSKTVSPVTPVTRVRIPAPPPVIYSHSFYISLLRHK